MDLRELVERINTALREYSDKDWNYSRIRLSISTLDNCQSPYVIWCEMIDTTSRDGKTMLKSAADEVKWGDRHSNELGILELVSLRINKALLECTNDEYWNQQRPVLRLSKKETLVEQGITEAFWYEVQEVAGEEFENR